LSAAYRARKLLHLETRIDIDPITGEASKMTTLLFPRFHQWELVTNLLATVSEEGSGHRYLAMHSAGSGKTNSIAWTAHGLATLFDQHNEKVFDTVIMVTDRTVLDDQLQTAISRPRASTALSRRSTSNRSETPGPDPSPGSWPLSCSPGSSS